MINKLNVAGIINDSIVDGVGLRMVIFTQGCSHHCKGCHNQQTWDFNERNPNMPTTAEEIFEQYYSNPILSGITLSGGDPFDNCIPELIKLCDMVHKVKGDVWIYTGYLFTDIVKDEEKNKLLDAADYIVDGPFIEPERNLTLKYRGSNNQRIWHKHMSNMWDDVTKKYNS